ncbi:MAG: rhomboid family intramembrane serine protease [Pseudanabaena sp. SU_2_4]|nr:rhomboid family intramembrane serine protease [Pseudanabaena sp. SU_2_4]
MIPLYDDNPTQRSAVLVYVLIAANVLIFLHESMLGQSPVGTAPRCLGRNSQAVFAFPSREAVTLLSSQFLHANFWHLLGNMWFLWIFGNNVEDKLGRIQFLGFYLICGAIAALTQSVFSPSSAVPLIGASGAIAGVMGAYIVRFPRAEIVTLIPIFIILTTVRIPALFFLGIWIAGQTIYAAMSNPGQPGVAYLAHISGFVAGIVLFKIFGERSDYS